LKVRLTQLDGKLPNLALMKLAYYHRSAGDEITFTRNARRDMFEPNYDLVYGSSIFTWSAPLVEHFRQDFPEAVIGGTGVEEYKKGTYPTVEQHLGLGDYEHYDYGIYPDFTGSIGFTARGCRLKCGFCLVPNKEGKPRSINTIPQLWRGVGHPKHLHLLDNDFFGQPRDKWEARVDEMLAGDFRVCFNQGINVRMVDATSAAVLARLHYFDDSFKHPRLYTAWDNLKDERIFFRGIEQLVGAGIKPEHIMVYMLVGYDPTETWERVFYRFNRMVEIGLIPYPMVYNNTDKDLKLFQKWVVARYYHIMPWDEFVQIKRKGRRELYEKVKGLDAHGPDVAHRRNMREERETSRSVFINLLETP
jgi:hypothetical protein